ncbi:MAG TPA: L-threonine 3-dehydrogenase [Gemmatimonadaceae bacterium]|nr:L-threonine 3-dehydrogenase [Gemmatimonadaceae bacterium]
MRTPSALPSLVRTGEVSTSDDGEARLAPEFPASSALSVRALVKAAAEPGFELREVARPSIRDNEVLIRVRRAGVCGTDVHIYDWDAWAQGRCHPPFTVGHEFAGDIVQVGHLVTDVREGDRVTAEGHIVCGRCHLCRTGNAHVCPNTCIIGVDRDGCFADYIAMPATNVWPLDEAISYEIGGIHDPMGNAFHTALTNTEVPGSTVLVTGCGPIGIFAVGICRAAGASRIIASDVNPTRLALARAMGAHDAVTPHEAEAAVRAATGSLGMDVVLEMSGVPSAIHQAFALVRDGGRVQMLGIPAKPMEIDFATEIIFKGLTVYGVVGRRMYETWIQMTQFLRSGEFDPTPVITHRFPLERYDEAIAAIKSGSAGKVVFEVS